MKNDVSIIAAIQAAARGFIDPAIEQFDSAYPPAREAGDAVRAAIEDGRASTLDDLEELLVSSEDAYETQGFINGFQMGMRLSGEVSNLDTGSLLHRIFSHAHVECSSPPLEEDRLSNLYKHMALAEKAFGAFTEVLDKLDIPEDMRDRLEVLRCDELSAFEEQGFINGIHLGMKLARELGFSKAKVDLLPERTYTNRALKKAQKAATASPADPQSIKYDPDLPALSRDANSHTTPLSA